MAVSPPSSPPPGSGDSSSDWDPSANPLRALPPPADRPLPALIEGLHARRKWFATARQSSHQLMADYLRHNWYDEEAQSWAAEQIEADAALIWRELGLRPVEAAELEREGCRPQELSALWKESDIPADEIADWIGAGLTLGEALAQRENGVTREDAAAMRSFRSMGGR